MSRGLRHFAALVEHEGVHLVEFAREKSGFRLLGHWTDRRTNERLEDALVNLRALLAEQEARRATLAIAMQQFGTFHHLMTLPAAPDTVLQPIINREIQRVFGIPDAVFAFVRGGADERREGVRANPETAPLHIFIGGAPRATIDALAAGLAVKGLSVEGVTIVPEAIRQVYSSAPRSPEPTAVVVCLAGGPHLSFFVDGHMALSVEPPIALEGEYSVDAAAIVDQVDRGAIFLRQQYRGAQATELLLAAPPEAFAAVATAVESATGMRVKSLAGDLPSPEAVVALGAALDAGALGSIDLFPHPLTLSERVRESLRGPRAAAAGALTIAALALIWFGIQYSSISSKKRKAEELRASIVQELSRLEPIKQVASHRAGYMHAVSAVRNTRSERAHLTAALSGLASAAPVGMSFDSLVVVRHPDVLAGVLAGRVSGASAGEAMRALDRFYTWARDHGGFGPVDLDQFDYPTAPADTAKRIRSTVVTLVFRMTLSLPTQKEGS